MVQRSRWILDRDQRCKGMNSSRKVDVKLLGNELIFTTSRSSGPGGQNVNKVNSKVTLKFHVINSEILSEEEKEIIRKKLSAKISQEGVLTVSSQDKRSQLQNKEAVVLKFGKLLAKAFHKKKVRKPTEPSKASAQKHITNKKKHSEKKAWRKKPF